MRVVLGYEVRVTRDSDDTGDLQIRSVHVIPSFTDAVAEAKQQILQLQADDHEVEFCEPTHVPVPDGHVLHEFVQVSGNKCTGVDVVIVVVYGGVCDCLSVRRCSCYAGARSVSPDVGAEEMLED